MWKNVVYLQNKWGQITSAHGLFQMAFNFARECVFLIGVSEGESVDEVVAGCILSHSTPLAHSLFRKSHYGVRPCQTGGVSRVNICLEGGGSNPSPENGACRLCPSCSDRPLSAGALWHTTEPAQATVSDDSLGYASCKEGFYRREDVNHREP